MAPSCGTRWALCWNWGKPAALEHAGPKKKDPKISTSLLCFSLAGSWVSCSWSFFLPRMVEVELVSFWHMVERQRWTYCKSPSWCEDVLNAFLGFCIMSHHFLELLKQVIQMQLHSLHQDTSGSGLGKEQELTHSFFLQPIFDPIQSGILSQTGPCHIWCIHSTVSLAGHRCFTQAKPVTLGMFTTMRGIWREGGLPAFWRGNMATLWHRAVVNCVNFPVNELCKDQLRELLGEVIAVNPKENPCQWPVFGKAQHGTTWYNMTSYILLWSEIVLKTCIILKGFFFGWSLAVQCDLPLHVVWPHSLTDADMTWNDCRCFT